MNCIAGIIVPGTIFIILIAAAICWSTFSKEDELYEVKRPDELPKHHCPKCNRILIPLPPNPKGEFQCLHCHTYYHLKSGGSECKTSAAPNATKKLAEYEGNVKLSIKCPRCGFINLKEESQDDRKPKRILD